MERFALGLSIFSFLVAIGTYLLSIFTRRKTDDYGGTVERINDALSRGEARADLSKDVVDGNIERLEDVINDLASAPEIIGEGITRVEDSSQRINDAISTVERAEGRNSRQQEIIEELRKRLKDSSD